MQGNYHRNQSTRQRVKREETKTRRRQEPNKKGQKHCENRKPEIR